MDAEFVRSEVARGRARDLPNPDSSLPQNEKVDLKVQNHRSPGYLFACLLEACS